MNDEEKEAVRQMCDALTSSQTAKAVLTCIKAAKRQLDRAYALCQGVEPMELRCRLVGVIQDTMFAEDMARKRAEELRDKYGQMRFDLMTKEE